MLKDTRQNSPQPIDPKRKANQVRRHHHKNIHNSTSAAQHAVRRGPSLPAAFRKERAGGHLREHEEDDEPAPDEQAHLYIVPEGDKGEDQHISEHGARGVAEVREARAAERHIDVAQGPAVEGAVPGAPEGEGAPVVADAADGVLGGVDAVDEGPEPEEAPGQQQLQPDHVQVEVAQEEQLRGRILGPARADLGDGLHVVVVQDDLHGQEREGEAEGVADGARGLEACGLVAELRDVVVEGDDGPREIQRRVDGVCDVVAEREVLVLRGGGDAVSFA